MATDGVVREWRPDEGWGVIDSVDTPGGCWVHVSGVRVDVDRGLIVGQAVTFVHEEVDQDGFAFRAVDVWPRGEVPYRQPAEELPSPAYHSILTITWSNTEPTG